MRPVLSLLAVLALLACAGGASAVGTLAEVRLVDRASGRELPVVRHAGRRYVAGRPGAEFAIAIRNLAGEDLLAVTAVDGVNVVSGRTATTSQGGYVLAPGERLVIGGWRKSLDETAAFYFTRLDDSYAARTGRPEDVGVVGVALFRRRVPDPPPAALSEGSREQARAAQAPATAGAADGPLGTGHGRREDAPARRVTFERATQAPEEIVTLYYDSRENLLAQGILPATAHRPRAFPGGFVPDPPG